MEQYLSACLAHELVKQHARSPGLAGMIQLPHKPQYKWRMVLEEDGETEEISGLLGPDIQINRGALKGKYMAVL
jgi:hypothetical protein